MTIRRLAHGAAVCMWLVLAAGLQLVSTGNATTVAGCMPFEAAPNGPFNVGDSYSEGGLTLIGRAFRLSNGQLSSPGKASKSASINAVGAAPEMQLNNIVLETGPLAAPFTQIDFKFAEHGGNINLSINGELANVDNFADINGIKLGGAYVSVTGGNGQDAGSVTIWGIVSQFSIGGQTLWLDDLCFTDFVTPINEQPIVTVSDLGDAPDSANHYGIPYTNTAYTTPNVVLGRFPTTYDPGTSPPSQGQGIKHLSVAHMWLGDRVTAEQEADQLPDRDGMTNILHLGADLANMDKGDDGWLNANTAVMVGATLVPAANFVDCQATDLVVRVTRSSLPLPPTLNHVYLNVWFDGMGNQASSAPDGDWKDSKDCSSPVVGVAREWIVRDALIPVIAPNTSQDFLIRTDAVPNNAPLGKHWIRFSLSNNPAVWLTTLFDADGRGQANGERMGETEDYLYDPNPPAPSNTDLGDAPDSSNHWGSTSTAYTLPVVVPGRFPTVWNSGVAGDASGPKHRNATVEGILGLTITGEDEADNGTDADVITNIKAGGIDTANNDQGDDGWLNPSVTFPHCATTTLKVRVRRGPAAVNNVMYLNAFFDGNRDGDWEGIADCPADGAGAVARAWEWVVEDQVVDMTAIPLGGFVDLDVPTRQILNTTPELSHWVRLTLSDTPAVLNSALTPPRADGRGPQQPASFASGETEDYLALSEVPFQMAANAGTTPQAANINTAFTNALAVTVADAANVPMAGVNVTFTAPASGASGKFSNNTATITVASNAAGIASAPFTANAIGGGPYTVTANAASLPAVNFSLANGSPLMITQDPANTSVAVGATASFTAAAAGFPTPTVQWFLSVDGGANFSPVGGATSATLSFTAQATDTNKLYRASFTNGSGSVTTTAATLTASFGPMLNIDNSDVSSTYDAQTDGVLLLRYLLGLRGAALIANARGTGASLRDATQISTHIETNLAKFDVDGDGQTLALTDALMILRRLHNPAASAVDPVVTSAIAANAKNSVRSNDNVVRAIDALKP